MVIKKMRLFRELQVVSRRGEGFTDVESLANSTVILQDGEIINAHVRKLNLTNKYIIVPDSLTAFSLLLQGKSDAFVCNSLIGAYYVNLVGGGRLELHSLDSVEPAATSFAVSKTGGKEYLLARLSEAEQAVRRSGVHASVYSKWFEEKPLFVSRGLILYGGCGFLAFLVLAGLFVRRIRERARTREKDLLLGGIDVPLELLDSSGAFISANKAFLDLMKLEKIKRWKCCTEFMTCPLGCEHTLDDKCVITHVMKERAAVKRTAEMGGRTYVVTATPIFDSSGGVLYIVKAYTDITDQNVRIAREKVMKSCLETFYGELDARSAICKASSAICGYMKGARFLVLRFDVQNGMACVWHEYSSDSGASVFSGASTAFKLDDILIRGFKEKGSVRIDASSRDDVSPSIGKLAEFLIRPGVGAVCCSSIFAGGELWGCFGIIYDRSEVVLSGQDRELLKHLANLFGQLLERESAKARLVSALDDAQRADKAKSFFLASVTHELRTPLNAVLGFTELLKAGGVPAVETVDYLNSISSSADSLLELVNDVIDLSKLESGSMTLLLEHVSFNTIVKEVVRHFSSRAEAKHIGLSLSLSPVPLLEMDKLRVYQIFSNLIGNAVKFTSSGGVEICSVFTSHDDGSGMLSVTVSDSGRGIPPDDLKNLTEPYAKLSRMRGTNASHTGTGLGLAIVRKLLLLMDASLDIESELGRGSCFTVTFQRLQIVRQESLPSDPRQDCGCSGAVEGMPRVLIVDDVEMNRKVMNALCAKSGIKDVIAVDSGESALKSLESRLPDLVLLDLWMPEMDGEELCRRLRADGRFRHLYIVAVTADMEASSNFELDCFDGVVNKPVTLPKISKLIDEFKSKRVCG